MEQIRGHLEQLYDYKKVTKTGPRNGKEALMEELIEGINAERKAGKYRALPKAYFFTKMNEAKLSQTDVHYLLTKGKEIGYGRAWFGIFLKPSPSTR